MFATWAYLRVMREWAARYPLVTAFLLSFAVHASLYEAYKWGERLGWWKYQATWLLDITKRHRSSLSERLAKLQKQLQNRQEIPIPLTFVEVDPSTAIPEPPKDAKYYGAMSSKAANPDPVIDSTVPKADGKQEKMVRLENVPKPGPQPLQPSLPPQPKEEAKPKEDPGDKFKKPEDAVEVGAGQAKRDKPRTLQEAKMRHNMLAGEKMRQDGGIRHRGKLSLDVIGSPFGAYDAMLIAAIQQRWYDLIDNTAFTQRSGKVVFEFHLNYDGRISDLNMKENEVGDLLALLCQRAVMDPSPYKPWPDDMRRMVGKNYREVLFTFYYE